MSSFEFIYDGEPANVAVEKSGDGFKVVSGEKEYLLEPAGENLYHVNVNGQRMTAAVVLHKGTYFIDIDSVLLEVSEPSEDGFAGGAGGHEGEKDKIFAPMPGKVVKLLVEVGDEIEEKQPMVIVEAMKMENQVNSKAKGVVKAINFSAGDQVDTETPIIELKIE